MRLEKLNLRNPISIGYYDPFSVFPAVEPEFVSKFPLSNLHWKYHPLKPVKSIPLLPVALKEEVPSKQHKSQGLQARGFDNVYLRLIFVQAESMDIYKSQVRPLIIAWLTELVVPESMGWAIVLVVPSAKLDKPSTLMKTSVFDKINMDFGPGGKYIAKVQTELGVASGADEDGHDHIFKLRQTYSDDMAKLSEYNLIIARFKILLLQTFDARYNAFTSEIERLETERLQALPEGDKLASLRLLYNKLKLMHILGDMRFLSESYDLYLEITELLKIVVKDCRDAFDEAACSLPEKIDLEMFYLESEHESNVPSLQLSRYLSEKTPINLFATKVGLFVNASLLLQSLANFATSVSVSSIHILSLLQKLILFVNDIAHNYANTPKMNEWFCALIDFYLNLPLSQKLIEINDQNSDGNGPTHVAEILEYTAELRLLRRTVLGKLAVALGYELPEAGFFLEDVSLDDSEKTSKGEQILFTYLPLSNELSSQESYEKSFETLTVSAIQDFASCDRIKTIDLLSVDLAILHYRRKEYSEAFDVLLSLYDYFIQHGWSFMGGVLLEVYVECLEKLDMANYTELLRTNLKLFATLKSGGASVPGINNYNLVKNENQRRRLFDKICDISSKLDKPFVFPMEELLGLHVSPYIEADPDEKDSYSVVIKVENDFAVEMKIGEIELQLEEMETGKTLAFYAENVTLKSVQQHEILVTSKVFRQGVFKLVGVVFKVTETLHFVHGAIDKSESEANETVVRHGIEEPQLENTSQLQKHNQPFIMFSDPRKFRVVISKPSRIEMGNSSFVLSLENGRAEIENIHVAISNITPGLNIEPASQSLSIEKLSPQESWSQQVPFTYYGDTKLLTLNVDVEYVSGEEKFEFHTTLSHDINLDLAISVQDIFRLHSLYSKFQIARANGGNLVRVLDCSFESPDGKYEISSPEQKFEPLLVFGEQPAYMFYRVRPKGDMAPSDTLDLTITYSDLHQECERALFEKLRMELCEAKLEQYLHVIQSELGPLDFDLNHYAFHDTVILKNASSCSKKADAGLSAVVRESSNREVLQEILAKLATNIPGSPERFSRKHQLYISVAVPFLSMLHQVEFQFERKLQYFVGEPIEARLCIDSSPKWKSTDVPSPILASSSPVAKKTPASRNFHFSVVQEENWIISGFKKQSFEIDESGGHREFSITLIPLNVGHLQLPKVFIRPNSAQEQSMDVVNENALETVLVVPELDSITFSF